MTPYESGDISARGPQGPDEADTAQARTGRRAARYVVPFAVIGVAAATIGLVPALADSGDPDLPKISAEQLIAKIAKSDVQQMSGTVKINTDLGLPDLAGAAAFAPGAAAGPGAHARGEGSGSAADPQAKLMELLSGAHTLRVAADGPDHQKLSVLDHASEYSVIHNGDEVWAYDSAANEAYHAKTDAKAGRHDAAGRHDGKGEVPATPEQLARQALKAVDDTTSVTVDGTAQVAGRDAYRLVIKPKQTGTTVGAITIAVDAKNGTPLKFTLTPAKGGSAVLDAGYTKVDFAKPAASTFRFTPPKGTKVTEADKDGQVRPHVNGHDGQHGLRGPQGSKGSEGAKGLNGPGGMKVVGKGWNAIAEFSVPGGRGLPSAGSDKLPPEAQGLLDALGDKAHGKFGSGTVFSTRLINVLMTDDGKVYAGAVTKEALIKAADSAR